MRQLLGPFRLLVVLSRSPVVRVDVTEDANENGQREGITLSEGLVLDSAEDTISKMVHLFHGTALTGKDTVGLLEYHDRQQLRCRLNV